MIKWCIIHRLYYYAKTIVQNKSNLQFKELIKDSYKGYLQDYSE